MSRLRMMYCKLFSTHKSVDASLRTSRGSCGDVMLPGDKGSTRPDRYRLLKRSFSAGVKPVDCLRLVDALLFDVAWPPASSEKSSAFVPSVTMLSQLALPTRWGTARNRVPARNAPRRGECLSGVPWSGTKPETTSYKPSPHDMSCLTSRSHHLDAMGCKSDLVRENRRLRNGTMDLPGNDVVGTRQLWKSNFSGLRPSASCMLYSGAAKA
mmetsp:Transcript_46123/g.128271  ORF Transcript_46123/g.128271 Transcript_46123/m.128271 type:complete len:211 (-) Transcript_46123:159-791(-)